MKKNVRIQPIYYLLVNEMMQKWEEENMDDQFNNMFMEEWGK